MIVEPMGASRVFEKHCWKGGPYSIVGYTSNRSLYFRGYDQVFSYRGKLYNAGGIELPNATPLDPEKMRSSLPMTFRIRDEVWREA